LKEGKKQDLTPMALAFPGKHVAEKKSPSGGGGALSRFKTVMVV
jgi:hypothetical protein